MPSIHHRDKENEVHRRSKDQLRTPPRNTVPAIKKQFTTPPLKENTRIPLCNKQDNNRRITQDDVERKDTQRERQPKLKPTSRMVGRRTPLKVKVDVLDVKQQQQQQFSKMNAKNNNSNSLLDKLNESSHDFTESDLKLDEFLKIEKGENIDIEIVPERQPSLLDAPDDSISFKDINLSKIYTTPFHVPEFEDGDQDGLTKLLSVPEFESSNDDDSFLKWDLANHDVEGIIDGQKISGDEEEDVDKVSGKINTKSMTKTPGTVLQNMKLMEINNKSPLSHGNGSSSSKKRFMQGTTSSMNKKLSMTPVVRKGVDKLSRKTPIVSRTTLKVAGRNLLQELVQENGDGCDKKDFCLSDDDNDDVFDEKELLVADEELRSLF